MTTMTLFGRSYMPENLKALTQQTLVPITVVLAAVLLTVAVCQWTESYRDNQTVRLNNVTTDVALIKADNVAMHASIEQLHSDQADLTKSITEQLKGISSDVTDIKIHLAAQDRLPLKP